MAKEINARMPPKRRRVECTICAHMQCIHGEAEIDSGDENLLPA
jgi:hypothetical protein